MLYMLNLWGSRGLMVESRTHNRKVASLSLGPAGIVGEGSECTALSPPSIPRRGALEQGTEPPTAPRAMYCCVCALGWVNLEHELRVWVTILYGAVCCMPQHFKFPSSLIIYHYCLCIIKCFNVSIKYFCITFRCVLNVWNVKCRNLNLL